jgi:UDP-N-acetylmuramate--alanine ligase
MTRNAADIARGLAPTRPARAIQRGERLHVIGVGGSAASGAGILAHGAGATVTACDSAGPSPYDRAVAEAGIAIAWEHAAEHVVGAEGRRVDRVAVTKAITSVRPDHPELEAARRAGIPTESVQQVIADAAISLGQRLIGVTGTHGKSTTTGWVIHQLVEAGHDPSGFVGALLPSALSGGGAPATARLGSGPDVVVEADEYAGNFDPYRPTLGAVVTIEWDHPDVFPDETAVVDVVDAWVRRFEGGADAVPVLVANEGDPGVRRLLARLADWNGRLTTIELRQPGRDESHRSLYRTALGPARRIVGRIASSDGTGTELLVDGVDATRSERARVAITGSHMATDGLVALAVALEAGVEPPQALRSMATFGGVGRRLELKGDIGGVVVLDDYGHHPTAIAATLAAARQRYPGRAIWAVYEPLTFHRTAAMLDAFAEVLATAERVAIVDIWAVRDLDTTIVSAADLAAATRAHGTPAIATGSPEESAERLAGLVAPGDVVLVMGGGRSYVVAERLVERLAERSAQADPATTSASPASSSDTGTA